MKWSTGWVLDESFDANLGDSAGRPGRVALSAGLDRIVEIDGLFDDDIARLRAWSAGGSIDPTDDSGRLVDQLIGLGALIPDAARSDDTITVAVVAGRAGGELATAIRDRLSTQDGFRVAVNDGSSPVQPASLTVALRTHDRLAIDRGTGDGGASGEVVVLHVDLRHEHTLVVGPVELPGLSACDTCYDTRLARRWQLPSLPDRPRVLDAQELLAELILFHLDRFASTGTHLVNATIAHSLLDGTAQIESLLRVPSCGGCEPVGVTTGRVRLPWQDQPPSSAAPLS